MTWIYSEVPIKEIKSFLDQGYDVEISSPDGYQKVSQFVDKGYWQGYEVEDLSSHEKVIVNENHLFETPTGWQTTSEMTTSDILMEDGEFHSCCITKLPTTHHIVDIQVDHPNHRYYANGFSSHNTHVGKTAFMCHLAAHYLKIGKSVLYVTLEMSEEEISKRIDANLLEIPLLDVTSLPKTRFMDEIQKIKRKTQGRLKIKEYPTAGANVNHIKAAINELRLKQGFYPDIIFVDYMNIMSSSRYRSMTGVNSYSYIKAIGEELRGLFVELEVVGWSATQFNRSAYADSDPGLDGVSESFATGFIADLVVGLIATEELIQQGLVMVSNMKNRYTDKNACPKFMISFDRSRMIYHNVDRATEGLSRGANSITQQQPAIENSNKFSQANSFADFEFGSK